MAIFRSLAIILHTVVFAWSFGQTLWAQEGPLSVTVVFDRQSYMVGEPIWPVVILRNRSASTVALPGPVHPDYGFTRLELRRVADQTVRAYLPLWYRDSGADVTLPPEGTTADFFPLFFDAEGWALTNPGTYEVVPSFPGAVSVPTTVVIERAVTAADQTAAADFIGSREAGLALALLFGSGDLMGASEVLQRVAARDDNSRHAVHAKLALDLGQQPDQSQADVLLEIGEGLSTTIAASGDPIVGATGVLPWSIPVGPELTPARLDDFLVLAAHRRLADVLAEMSLEGEAAEVANHLGELVRARFEPETATQLLDGILRVR